MVVVFCRDMLDLTTRCFCDIVRPRCLQIMNYARSLFILLDRLAKGKILAIAQSLPF